MTIPRALGLSALIVAVDQAVKAWVVATLPFGAQVDVIPNFFRLVHTRNRGIAFGLFGNVGTAGEVALVTVVMAIIVFVALQFRHHAGRPLAAVGLALVLGGALGNLVDRFFRGEVVDFLDFFVVVGGREHHWPAFNVADACISVGAGCIIVAEILSLRRREHASDPD
jgi:signal peptidase II